MYWKILRISEAKVLIILRKSQIYANVKKPLKDGRILVNYIKEKLHLMIYKTLNGKKK